MVDLTFESRTSHFVPLALLKHLAGSSVTVAPEEVRYIGEEGLAAVKGRFEHSVVSIQSLDYFMALC